MVCNGSRKDSRMNERERWHLRRSLNYGTAWLQISGHPARKPLPDHKIFLLV